MKKTLIAGLVMAIGVAAWTARAADPEAGKGLTAEQQQQRSALIKKYDLNQDGVLDQREAKEMDKADKNELAKLGGIGTAKKRTETGKVEKAWKAGKTEKVEKAGKKHEKSDADAAKPGKAEKKSGKADEDTVKPEKVEKESGKAVEDTVKGAKGKDKK